VLPKEFAQPKREEQPEESMSIVAIEMDLRAG
jgi:hypothetical protein